MVEPLKTISRLDFLKLIVAGAAISYAVCNKPSLESPKGSSVAISATPSPGPTEAASPTPEPTPTSVDITRLMSEDSKYKPKIIKAAQSFMALAVPSHPETRNQRSQQEIELFKFLEDNRPSAADILFAIAAAGTVDGRAWGMELLWRKRQARELANFGIQPLDQPRIDWAVRNNCDPKSLAVAIDTMDAAKELLEAAPDLYFEAIPADQRKNLVIEDTLVNPGLLAKLDSEETGHTNSITGERWSFIWIGGGSSWDELNLSPNWFPSGHEDLQWIAERLQQQTGLPYADNIRLIPGSQKGPGDGSGGGLAKQFLPINARVGINRYTEANKRLSGKYPEVNPFEPYTGTIIVTQYLAGEFYPRFPNISTIDYAHVRPGYNFHKSDVDKMKVLYKWNPKYSEARAVLDAGYDYHKFFGRR